MKKWEWIFPIFGVAFALWATIPDLSTMCAWNWESMCGLDAIIRFDILLPLFFPLVIWALVRTVRR